MQVKPGDKIEVDSTQVGGPVRRGQVDEVMSDDPLELRVTWDDGHTSVLYPTGGMVRVVEPR
jgi:hypothetical protein